VNFDGTMDSLYATFRKIFKNAIFSFASILLAPLKFAVKKKNVVILQSRSRQVYCDNTRYLYELLSQTERIDAYWVTDNTEIKRYIASRGWNYITWYNPIKLIRVALKAKVIVDNGSGFFDAFYLARDKSVFKVCVGHGIGPKATLERSKNIMTAVRQILDINEFDYVSFPSNYFSEVMGKKTYFLPNEKIVKFGYPRCDAFFNAEYVEEAHQDKKVVRALQPLVEERDRIILYTPTWRPYAYTFPLLEMPGFSFDEFDAWLKTHNMFFFYTVHSNLYPENIPQDLDRIMFVNPDLNPLFDINRMMLETDVLVNDYSTTSTDFSLLQRPQIFYMPDYDYYDAEKCFIDPFRESMPGKEVVDYDEFKLTLQEAVNSPKNYVNKHSEQIKLLQDRYYDINLKNSTEELRDFFVKLCEV